ncbi:MAG: RidA family protein [Cyanobacteria bacterium J06642_9]
MMKFQILQRWQRSAIATLALIGITFALILTTPLGSRAAEIIRYPIPNSTFPIARAVEIPADATLIYLSGQVPPVIDDTAEPTSIAAFGNTETQTLGVLTRIEGILNDLDLTIGDVVKMQVFLVGDPALEGRMDFNGFMAGYTQFFGTETQPNLPARSAMQIAGLVNPGWLVEIEVVAIRPLELEG